MSAVATDRALSGLSPEMKSAGSGVAASALAPRRAALSRYIRRSALASSARASPRRAGTRKRPRWRRGAALAWPHLDAHVAHALLQLGPFRFRRLARAVGQHHDELIAGVPHEQVVGPQQHVQRHRHLPQRLIADVMTVRVIDRLEVVDIHHDERDLALQARRPGQLAREMVEQRPAVRESRQRVGERIGLGLLEHDRIVNDGGRLCGHLLEQPAMILRVSVALDDGRAQACR